MFVIDVGVNHMATVKMIIRELVTWPQIAESDVRVSIINFNDAGDEATVGSGVFKAIQYGNMAFCYLLW